MSAGRFARRALLGLAASLALVALSAASHAQSPKRSFAIFAGGCFWCMEPPYDKLDGVLSTVSGYIGGSARDATYERVSAGVTKHYEALRVEYDPGKVSYEKLLEIFWLNHDPHDAYGQFCDKGPQYRAAVFVLDDAQKAAAEASLKAVGESGRLRAPIVTQILPAGEFYAAEDYHQDYYKKNPLRYRYYRTACGRDARLQQIWGASPTN